LVLKENKNLIVNRTSRNKKKSALFLDRDGVIIEDKHYLSNPSKVKLCNGIKDIVKSAIENDFIIVVITNQSGIGKGLFGWDDYKSVTERMLFLLGDKYKISAIYANSYTDFDNGYWRKPKPGMFFEAAKDLSIDLESSIIIGDRDSDLKAGTSAGLKKLVHVLTGHGKDERQKIIKKTDKFGNYIYQSKRANLTLIKDLSFCPRCIFKKEKIPQIYPKKII
tara:strand:+ start:386 stop:1051 length:666 start_codon:yes stop_codon:yes gene_type:complete